MFEELYEVQRRYEELAYRMTTPGAAADAAGYARLMRDYKELTPLIETWQRYRGLQAEIAEEEQALEQEQDPAFTDMVQQELRKNRETLSVLEENLRVLLLPRDADDDKSIIMEIRAGTGGEEAALFARDLYRMYTMYAARRGWGCETVSASETELGGLKEIVFSIEGAGVYSRLKFESGAHRVQRVPQTEAQGRIQTSAATVAVMPEAEEVELELDPRDLRIDTFRASAPAASTSTRPPRPSGSPTCPPAWWWNARTSAASGKTGTGPSRCCAAGCCSRNSRPMTRSTTPAASLRWATATAANAFAPTTSPRAASPTTASA